MFGIFFSWQGKVYGLRKKYDRARERTDRESDPQKRLYVLKILDQVENTLVMLEEEKISRLDRARLYGSVKSAIEQAIMVLDEKFVPQQQAIQQRPVR